MGPCSRTTLYRNVNSIGHPWHDLIQSSDSAKKPTLSYVQSIMVYLNVLSRCPWSKLVSRKSAHYGRGMGERVCARWTSDLTDVIMTCSVPNLHVHKKANLWELLKTEANISCFHSCEVLIAYTGLIDVGCHLSRSPATSSANKYGISLLYCYPIHS